MKDEQARSPKNRKITYEKRSVEVDHQTRDTCKVINAFVLCLQSKSKSEKGTGFPPSTKSGTQLPRCQENKSHTFKSTTFPTLSFQLKKIRFNTSGPCICANVIVCK